MEQADHDICKLIEKSTKRDMESSKKLYELLVDKVFAYVRSRTSTHEEATDVTQDTFIDFFSTLSNFTYQSRAQFYAYVFVITRRKLARHYNNKSKKGTTAVVFDESTMSPHDSHKDHELGSDMESALSTLEDSTREIVVLHHWSRYTFGEIATLLDMKESAVRVRHHRALALLATYLKQ